MTNIDGRLERKQAQRLAVLKHMYDVTAGQLDASEHTWFSTSDISEDLRLSVQDIESAITYLVGEGLVERDKAPLEFGEKPTYKITHSGVKEVERTMLQRDLGTERFPTQVVQHFYSNVGAVQTGSHATATVTQNIGPNLALVFEMIDQLRQEADQLPEDEQEDFRDTLDVLNDELKGSRDPKRIRATLRGLASFGRGTVAFASQVATLATQVKDLLSSTPT